MCNFNNRTFDQITHGISTWKLKVTLQIDTRGTNDTLNNENNFFRKYKIYSGNDI